MSELVRDNTTGRFVAGTGGRRKGSKGKITQKMLTEFMEYDDAGGNTPFKLWRDVLDGKHDDQLNEMGARDGWNIRMKAAECLAKYVYDASFETDEAASKLEMSLEQINALKAAFPQFKK